MAHVPSSPRPIAEIVAAQRAYFASGATLDPAFRQQKLRDLRAAILDNEALLLAALRDDLGKGATEAYMTEVGQALAETGHMAAKLKCWARPRRARLPLALGLASGRIHPEPLGLALIFAPWNYPLQLTLGPLAAAVAAGDCAALKPSSSAPATARALEGIVASVFAPEHVSLIAPREGANEELLAERFDFIFYTGSTRVGRVILEAAARHLTPVCLELGGKSPVIIAPDADLDIAARRVAWGKMLNAGQTCVAPDYVWIERRAREPFLERLARAFAGFLGPDPLHNPDYGRIVSHKAFDRLLGLADIPLTADRNLCKIAPTAFAATPGHPAMAEEIFGPLLPVLAYDDIDEAFRFVRGREKPLAFYLFTNDKALERRALAEIPFGGGCVNDVLLHVSAPDLPFGGVGASGMGRYHGKAGFDLFSNLKSVVHQRVRPDIPLRYPPFGERRLQLFRKVIK